MQEDIQETDQGSLLVSFAERTTAHGVSRLAHGSLPQRLLWFLIIVGASCGFCVHLHQLVNRYTERPVSTSFVDKERVKFPWVTICPTDYLFKQSSISATLNGVLVSRAPDHILNSVARLYYSLVEVSNWSASIPDIAPEYHENSKLNLRSHFYKPSRTYQDTHEAVIYCQFNSETCSFLNFTIYKDEKYFGCVTFNPENGTLAQAGEAGGLFLMLYRDGISFYNEVDTIETSSAFKVALHEPGQKPDMSRALTAPLAYRTAIQFNTEIDETIDRFESPCIANMPNATYTSDYSRPGDFENVTFYGSVQDCEIRAKQMEFVRDCGCLGDHLAIPTDLMQQWPLCHDLPDEVALRDIRVTNHGGGNQYVIMNNSMLYEPLENYINSRWSVLNTTATTLKCYNTVLQRQATVGVSYRACRRLCRTVRFPASRTSDPWPTQTLLLSVEAGVKKFLYNTMTAAASLGRPVDRLQHAKVSMMRQLHRNYAVLRIFSMSTQITNSKEDFAYTLKDVFSDLGGILGLWVGISVITLMEVMELVVQLVRICTARANNRSIAASNDSATGCKAKDGEADRELPENCSELKVQAM